MQIFRAADYKRMPWKNGGGETSEIAVFPAGADMASFGWRISMARVASDGPFSVFPGIDRTLTILDGGPMELTIGGQQSHILDRHSSPLAFAADVPSSAALRGGSVTDLNVMTRRDSFDHTVRIVFIQEEPGLNKPRACVEVDETNLIFCIEGAISVNTDQTTAGLNAYDCCISNLEDGDAVISGSGKAAVITIKTRQ